MIPSSGVGDAKIFYVTKSQDEIPRHVDALLEAALAQRASDIHIEPAAQGYELRARLDGILTVLDRVTAETGRALVGRLMVMGQLLTYRVDIPQEGRIHYERRNAKPLDLRLAIMPTTHGLRAAIRMPAELLHDATLEALSLPASVTTVLKEFAAGDSGMLIFTGPAGAGKTTTIYGLLDQIVRAQAGMSVISLEDPVERDLPGVTQIEVRPFGELTYERALRSILRQDPQVLALGEIRDSNTAALAVQAALSGHRLVCTLHAADPAIAITRLLEMGIESYQVASSVFGIVSQRLLRRTANAGYSGRVPVAEVAVCDAALRQAILQKLGADALREAYTKQPGFLSMHEVAAQLVESGVTDAAEVERVLGTQSPRL